MKVCDPLLRLYEAEFWQIQRMHNHQISAVIEVSPDYGVLLYRFKLFVLMSDKRDEMGLPDIRNWTFQGVNLWKRYKQANAVLKDLYKSDLYKYQSFPRDRERPF